MNTPYASLTREQRALVRRWRAESANALATLSEHREPWGTTSRQYGRADTASAAIAFANAKRTLAQLRGMGIEPATVR